MGRLRETNMLPWEMLSISVEMRRLNDGGVYRVIAHSDPVVVRAYRGLCAGALMLQGLVVVRQLHSAGWRSAYWVHAMLLWAIGAISALTENGEQARLIAAAVPTVLCLDYGPLLTAVRRMQNQRNLV